MLVREVKWASTILEENNKKKTFIKIVVINRFSLTMLMNV